jgi:hypothetical protein
VVTGNLLSRVAYRSVAHQDLAIISASSDETKSVM